MRRLDYTGRRFGKLTVLSMSRMGPHAGCICMCDCGGRAEVRACSLRVGYTKSCGCAAKERIAAANLTHGDCVGRPSVEWITWRSMHQRCYNPAHKSFKDYGGRGIRVCARWRVFASFLADIGRRPSPRHSIDRINNDGNYEPSNCRWATASEQARNRRPRREAA